MPLPLPRLDNRTFDQLVAEGQVLLPRYAPAWTDYNAHDPGITLLELLAWLTESGFYRLDRLPAAGTRAFLRLVGVVPRPAQAAETVVVAAAAPAAATTVPTGTRVVSADGEGAFQTTRAIALSPARLVAVLAGPAGDLADRSRESTAYAALGPSPQVGDALYLGFDAPLASTPAPLSLFVAAGDEAADRRTRALLEEEWASAAAEALRDHVPPPVDVREHYAARLAWEYHTGGGAWAALSAVDDQTRALTLSGFVRFQVPTAGRAHAPGGVAVAGQAACYFVRARLAAGRYDCPPRVRSVVANAIDVCHGADQPRKLLGPSTGRAGQTFQLGAVPVLPGSTRVEVLVPGVPGGAWREVATWDGVGPHDRDYVLDPERGEVSFGNGRIGRVPPAGARIWASFRAGGGPLGNVRAGTLTELGLAAGTVPVSQPFPALGGDAAEDLDGAISRALTRLTGPSRAVTPDDFVTLVLAMPGVPVARAHALVDYHPDLTCLEALGSITLVVVPFCPAERPKPSPELLCAVARYLHRRRPVTTEVHVVGPCYTTVSVQARLHAAAGADGRKLAADARAALARFFDPLRGGPEGKGWPVGRNVYRAEVLALLNELSGVTYVDQLVLRTEKQPDARCGNATVCPHGLVASGSQTITVDFGSPCP